MIGIVVIHDEEKTVAYIKYDLGELLQYQVPDILSDVKSEWTVTSICNTLRWRIAGLYNVPNSVLQGIDAPIIDVDVVTQKITCFKSGEMNKELEELKEKYASYFIDEKMIEDIYMVGYNQGLKNKEYDKESY